MPLQIQSNSPKPSDFVAVAEHQSETPQSFFNGPQILYADQEQCLIVLPPESLESCEALRRWFQHAKPGTNGHLDAHEQSDLPSSSILVADILITSR